MRRSRPIVWARAFPPIADEGAIWLTWLVRLRWVALFAQIITLGFTFQLLSQPGLVLTLLGGVMAVLVGANLTALRQLGAHHEAVERGENPEPVAEHVLLAQLALDVTALTAFFGLAGGPDNSFTTLYLIHVAMGAVMLSPRRAATLAGVVLLAYALLHLGHLPLHLERHSLPRQTLLRLGHLLSFGITTVAVATFVVGLASSLRRRKQQLLEARDRTARTDRLRSVGTLAAGAAHELNTPLSTIGLRIRRIARRHGDEDTTRDLEVIRNQLERCTQVVDQLLVGAGDPAAADIERRPLAELVHAAVGLWTKGSTLHVVSQDASDGLVVEVPRIAFVQALINLLENAREAQEEVGCFDPLHLRVSRQGDQGVVELADRGCGLPDSAEQVGEPFFTTKPTGTGLGVYVARAVADGAGGGLRYLRGEPSGTVARWWFPEVKRRTA